MEASSPRQTPFLKGAPLIGSLPTFARDRLGLLRSLAELGDIAAFKLGPMTTIAVNSPALIREVLVDRAADFRLGPPRREELETIMGKHLLMLEGDYHAQQRRLLAPLFQPRAVGEFAGMIVDTCERATASWKEGQSLDLRSELTHLSLDIVARAISNVDAPDAANEIAEAVLAANDFVNQAMKRMIPIPLSWPLPSHQRFKRALQTLRTHADGLIARRREISGGKDLLARILEARDQGQGVSDEQARDHFIGLIAAGHETIRDALLWTFCLLAKNPTVHAKLCRELDTELGGRSPTAADLPRLPYSLQVIKETLRLYPAGYMLLRTARRDLDLAGHAVRAGQMVLLCVYNMHRRPELFEDPERFSPERFTPEREKALPRFAYLPFSGGPHVCIGSHFALLEGQLAVAAISQRFEFQFPEGQTLEPEPLFSLTVKGDVRPLVRRRPAPPHPMFEIPGVGPVSERRAR